MRLLALALLAALAAPAHAADPAGNWQALTRDGTAPSGVVRLFLHDGLLYGDIVDIYDPPRRSLRCTRCTDDRRDAPFLGLQILRALHPDGDAWTGGTILDPDTGHTYRATLRLTDPTHLTVRGYLGISLFGGSQTWTRLP